jgi:hypothetical protein
LIPHLAHAAAREAIIATRLASGSAALSSKRIALPILLVCALSLGGWLTFGPAWPRPVRAEPLIDIETPAVRARLDAALALARMPDEPWTVSKARPAASAASDAQADGARCGEDQMPVSEPPVPDADGRTLLVFHETRPGGVGYTGAIHRIDAALRSSGDPFDRGVADALNVGDVQTPSGRLDALVQDAMTSSDPRLYALAVQACNALEYAVWVVNALPQPTSPRCAQLDMRDWASRDPGNAVPWLHVLQQADQAGDRDAQREALQRIATSSTFDVHLYAGAAAIARLKAASDADLAAQALLSMRATSLVGLPPFSGLIEHCRNMAGGDAEMAATCETISEAMFDHSDTFMSRNVGASLHKLTTGDGSLLERAHREEGVVGRRWAAEWGGSACSADRGLLRQMVRLGTHGEVALMKQDLKSSTPVMQPSR